jgi:hypothetical protein
MAAQKPDGKRPTRRVGFTRQSADRIAKVVRTIEQGDRKGAGLSFGSGPRSSGGGGTVLRVAKYTGAWTYQATKDIQFLYLTTTPNTVSVINDMFASLPDTGTNPLNCVIAQQGTAWSLVNVEHGISGLMSQDFNLSTTELRITRSVVNFVGGTTAAQVISVANCSTQVASGTSQSLFFG